MAPTHHHLLAFASQEQVQQLELQLRESEAARELLQAGQQEQGLRLRKVAAARVPEEVVQVREAVQHRRIRGTGC